MNKRLLVKNGKLKLKLNVLKEKRDTLICKNSKNNLRKKQKLELQLRNLREKRESLNYKKKWKDRN